MDTKYRWIIYIDRNSPPSEIKDLTYELTESPHAIISPGEPYIILLSDYTKIEHVLL
jgi:hypothetical protein